MIDVLAGVQSSPRASSSSSDSSSSPYPILLISFFSLYGLPQKLITVQSSLFESPIYRYIFFHIPWNPTLFPSHSPICIHGWTRTKISCLYNLHSPKFEFHAQNMLSNLTNLPLRIHILTLVSCCSRKLGLTFEVLWFNGLCLNLVEQK